MRSKVGETVVEVVGNRRSPAARSGRSHRACLVQLDIQRGQLCGELCSSARPQDEAGNARALQGPGETEGGKGNPI